MGKRKESTPRSRVRSALRQVWLRSRERSAAIKREGGKCERCGSKQSAAKGKEVKLEVHHREGVLNWDEILGTIFGQLLVDPDKLEVLCTDCHGEEHGKR